MRSLTALSLAASVAVIGTSACSDFLSSNKVKRDPNNPSTATAVREPQAQVYSDLQALLSQAITNLGGAGPGPGPGTFDLAYGGNTAKWIEAANTLKARLYMHTVELDNNQIDNGALNNAITYALLGISSAANDFKSRHTSQPGEDNMWYQFNFRSGFGQYVV